MPHMNLPIQTTIAATDVLHEAWYQSDVEQGPAVCTQVCSRQKLPLDRSGANVGKVLNPAFETYARVCPLTGVGPAIRYD